MQLLYKKSFLDVRYTGMMNNRYRQLFTSQQVSQRIEELAVDLVRDHHDSNPLFIALLRGAAPFASMLMFAIARHDPEFHPDIDHMMVSTYGKDHTAKQPVIVTDLAPGTSVTGRAVIILDDVIDLGITSDFVRTTMLERGAASVKLAVLGNKTVVGRKTDAEYVGFDCGEKWLVGMGLDDAQAGHEHYRWLDEIWEIDRP